MEDRCNCHKTENKKYKEILYTLSLLLFFMGFIPIFTNIKIIIYGIAVLLCGYDLLIEGIKNILKLNFEEDTLMTIAVVSAFILGEFPESVAVILLYKLGEYLENRARKNSNESIEKISQIKANTANLIVGKEVKVVDVNEIKIGDTILIKSGDKVPVDAIITKGKSQLDTSNITGESKLKNVVEKQEILSGSINISSAIECKVIRDFKNSTASQIVDLVHEAKNNKGNTEKFITKFSKIYTPIVILMACAITILPPLIFKQQLNEWLRRGLVFLVASCPCSLVISIPLAFLSGLGNISKKGMIIKGTKHLENLSKTTAMCFDKTGTLTTGEMEINKIVELNKYSKQEILTYIYNIEKLSNHPIANAVIDSANKIEKMEVKEYKEITGKGVYGKIDNKQVIFGNKKILDEFNITYEKLSDRGIYLAIDTELVGYIEITEKIRNENENIVQKFNNIGIKKIVMLTGDNKKAADEVSKKLGITEMYSELLPKEKIDILNKMKNNKEIVTFVGDGINDSPVILSADFGISMGNGTEIANNSADGILISNNINSIPDMIIIARKSLNIAKFNIMFSIITKIVVLILGVIGIAPIWLAVFADTGVTALTVLNSMRIINEK